MDRKRGALPGALWGRRGGHGGEFWAVSGRMRGLYSKLWFFSAGEDQLCHQFHYSRIDSRSNAIWSSDSEQGSPFISFETTSIICGSEDHDSTKNKDFSVSLVASELSGDLGWRKTSGASPPGARPILVHNAHKDQAFHVTCKFERRSLYLTSSYRCFSESASSLN